MIKIKILGLIIISLFLFSIAYCGAFEYGTATLLDYKTTLPDAATLAIPMKKCAIGMLDTLKYYVVTGPGWLWYSNDGGSTWYNKDIFGHAGRPNFAVGDHSSICILGDTIMIAAWVGASTQGMVTWYHDTTELGWDTLSAVTSWPRGVLIADETDDNYFWIAWYAGSGSLQYNTSYYRTNADHNIMGEWDTIYNANGHSCRTGAFEWIGGHPSFVTLEYTNDAIYRHDWNGLAVVGHNDSLIYNPINSAQERAFSCDGIIIGGDSLFFFVNAKDTFLIARWKGYHGGTGSYIVDTIAEANYVSIDGEDFQNTSAVINNKFCIQYINRDGADDLAHQYLYMRCFDPSDSSWSMEELVTQGLNNQGYVYYPNAVQKTVGHKSFTVWQTGPGSDSLGYITITDISSGDGITMGGRRRRLINDK